MNLLTIRGNIFSDVKSQVNIEEVASRLNLNLVKEGQDLAGQCPTGHPSQSKKSFRIVSSSRETYFHCFNCGKAGDAIRLVSITKKISDLEAVKWLIDEFKLKIDISQHRNHPKPTPEEIKLKEELISRAIILEKIVEIGRQKLYEEEGKEALQYLVKDRGYDENALKKTEWFYLPTLASIKKDVVTQYPEMNDAIGKSKLIGYFGDHFRLAFPYRTAEGLITGFLKRATDPKGISLNTFDNKEHDNVRWDSTPGLNKDDLFGLDKIDVSADTIIVVEGYPDAIYLQALGIKNIAAVGQGKLGKKHLGELRKRKIKNLIISFDNDGVGSKNTKEAVELILENSNITPYIIDPKVYGDKVKDPDEYFKKHGFEMLKNLFRTKAEDGAGWVVKELISGIEEKNSLERKEIKERIIDFLSLVKDETTIAEILDTLKRTFGDSLISLKKQLKGKKKDYKEELVEHINNDPIIPLNDKNSNTKCYYDAERDVLNFSIDRELIKEFMIDYGLVVPDNYPTFTVKFDPQDMGSKFDLYSKTFNLFTPTEYMFLEKNNDVIDLEKSCPCIYTVISNVVPDAGEREIFINWLSFTFSTRLKSIVAWLIRGTQGTGKNLMFEEIITPLWGVNHCSIVGNSALENQFNPHMKNKMMIAYNEVTTDYRSDKKDKESKIKAYVSDSTVDINEKNVRQYTLENYSNSLFFSNYEVPIIIEDGDRRFNVVENFNKLENHPYYKKFKTHRDFLKTISSELLSFAQYLVNYNHDVVMANRVFMNSAKQKIVGSSMGMFEEFAKKLIEKDYEWLRDESGVFLNKGESLESVKDGYILKDLAVDVFNRLYSKNFPSPNILSKQLQHYGINTKGKVTVNNSRYPAYKW